MKPASFTLSCIVTAILLPFFSPAQDKVFSLKEMHDESYSDPYLPNAYDNKKTSPGYRYKSGKGLRTSGATSITTVQVNVNSGGQNIIGDAANETSIAIHPINTDSMVIGWRQFDNIISSFRQAGWSYTSDGGQTWTFPGVIEPGIFRSDPVLDFDSNGSFFYNSLTNSPAYMCKVFESNDGGATWDAGTDAEGGDKQWMAIDRTGGVGNGNIYSFWTAAYSICTPESFIRSENNGVTYDPCIFLDGDPFWGTMAVGKSGELYIAAGGGNIGFGSDNIIFLKSLNAQTPGSVIAFDTAEVFMDGSISGNFASVNPGGLLGQINVDSDISNGPGQGYIYVLASLYRSQSGDQGDVMFARSTDGGITWDPPVRVNDDVSTTNTQWFGTMSVAPNGRIDAAWLDTRDATPGTDESALYYSYSIDNGVTWSVNEMLSPLFDPHVGYPNQNKLGDYFDMLSDNTGAHLAWANTFNSEQDAYYSHIVPPVSGINESEYHVEFSILPNPNNGVFNIATNGSTYEVEIYSLLGEKVYSAEISKSSYEINISTQPSGIYILKLLNEDGVSFARKLIRK